MSDAKAKIRKGTLFNRRLLARDVWLERNQKIESQLFHFIKERKFECCHVFLPIRRNQEFDTWNLAKLLIEENIKVMISVSDFESSTMSHFYYSDQTEFELNKFDIPEPVNAIPANIQDADMILVPLLAADKQGNRIGYGKGFYDRLLTGAKKDVVKVGVSLAPLFDQFGFAEPHDIRVDYCVTPQKIFDCNE